MIATSQELSALATRVEKLEKHSHEPFDFTHLIERLEAAEKQIVDLQADVEYLRNVRRD